MNDLDSLFESVRGSAIADVIRDSKIILVTEFDTVHPLKIGEFWFEEESNTLYVGAGQVMDNMNLYITNFLEHRTYVTYIPSPRLSTSVEVQMPQLSSYTEHIYKPITRLQFAHEIDIPNIITTTTTNKTHLLYHEIMHEISNVEIVKETEVI